MTNSVRDVLIKALSYCPICGGELYRMTTFSEIKMCNNSCGEVTVTPKKMDGRYRVIFLPAVEEEE